jgi:hypothetical protein
MCRSIIRSHKGIFAFAFQSHPSRSSFLFQRFSITNSNNEAHQVCMPVSFSVRLCLAFSLRAAYSHSRFLMKLREESVTVELKNGGVVQGLMAKHCVLLEHVSMHSCCLIFYNRLMGSQHISRHCYRSGPRHEHAHEECQVHCQGQKPRVFGAPLCSRQHGVFFPIDIFLFICLLFLLTVTCVCSCGMLVSPV